MRRFPLLIALWNVRTAMSFAPSRVTRTSLSKWDNKASITGTRLGMGKGLNRAKNKQAELARKLQLAKKQRYNADEDDSEEPQVTKEQESEELSRLEFTELLTKHKPPPPPDSPKPTQRIFQPPKKKTVAKESSSGRKVKARDLKRKRKKARNLEALDQGDPEEHIPVVLDEGDKARRKDFENLLSFNTRKPLGPIQAAQLVPWVPPFLTEYLVVLADPRRQSSDLRQAISYSSTLADSATAATTFVAVTADPINDKIASAVLKKQQEESTRIQMLADTSSLDWMQTYSCLGNEDRWSLHVLIFDSDGMIRKHCDKVDPSHVSRIVSEICTGSS